VSDAVHRLFSVDVEPRLDPKVFVEGNDFRKTHAYLQVVDKVLRKWESSLRIIFERLTKLNGQSSAAGIANKMVDFDTWKDFARLFDLFDNVSHSSTSPILQALLVVTFPHD
jgi:hypothetical protein